MKAILLAVSLFAIHQTICAQTVKLVSTDQLINRIDIANDTVYIVTFWATWCIPCLEELPHFERFSNNFKTEKLKVLLVSMDFPSKLESTVVPYVKKANFSNEVLLLDEKDMQKVIDRIDPKWSGTIPATIFLYRKKRNFIEREFIYNEILTEYKKITEP